jgi:multidrug efflux pump subunit AcrA (membrane-fusion protein)
LSVASGSGVLANSALAPAPPVLIIGGLGPAEIMISVGESDINKIKMGQEAEIKLDAVDGKIYKGVIKRFDENGNLFQGVVKFNTYLEIIDADDQIKPGMTADIDIITDKLTDVLSVQNTAVKPYQKGRAVRKLGAKGEIEFIPVKIGVRGKEFTQIIEGLSEGQEVIESLTNEKTSKKSLLGF